MTRTARAGIFCLLGLFFTFQLNAQTPCSLGTTHWEQALQVMSQGKLDSAIQLFESAAEIYLKASPEDTVCWDYFLFEYVCIASCLLEKGEQEKLLQYESQIIPNLHKGHSNYPYLPQVYTALGNAHKHVWNNEKAIDLYKGGLEVTRYTPNPEATQIELYTNLASSLQQKGDFEEALDYYAQAIRLIRQKDPDSSNANFQWKSAVLKNNIALLYRNKGEEEKAIEWYLNCLDLINRPVLAKNEKLTGKREKLRRTLHHNLSKAYQETGECTTALAYLNRIQNSEHQLKEKGTLYKQLASTYLCLGEYEKAIQAAQTALKLRQEGFSGKHVRKAVVYEVLGNTYARQEKWEEALDAYYRGIDQFAFQNLQGNTLPDVHQLIIQKEILPILRGLGDTYKRIFFENRDIKNLKNAFQTYQLAIAILENMRMGYRHEGSTLYWQAQAHYFFETAIQTAIEIENQTHDLSYSEIAFYLSEKGKALLLTQNLAFNQLLRERPLPEHLLKQRDDLLAKEAFLEMKLIDENETNESIQEETFAEIQEKIFKIRADLQSLHQQLGKLDPVFAGYEFNVDIPDLTQIQKALQERQTQLVSYFRGEKTLFTFSITPISIQVYHQPIPDKFDYTLDLFLNPFYHPYQGDQTDSIIERELAEYIQTGSLLYDWLLRPVLESRHSLKNLVIIPDGKLSFLPFEALITHIPQEETTFRDLPYVLHSHSTHYSFSLQFWYHLPDRDQFASNMYAGFAPEYRSNADHKNKTQNNPIPQNWPPLLHNQLEIETLAGDWKGETFANQKATKTAFMELASKYRILHLAMHAYANPENPSLSGLVFSNEGLDLPFYTLFAHEIRRMRLSAELVLLSACETGIGKIAKGEGVMSLARAFREAGSGSIMMSLWQINDFSSGEIIKTFSGLLKEGKGKAEALSQAKIIFLENAEYEQTHPRFWTALVLIGDNEKMSTGNRYTGWILLVLLGIGVGVFIAWKKRHDLL
ncbi:MAG: CHAT domain-containing protein [Bacteroidetes bacterium]|nr:CHAT domain-containing protein [Bacteroidota bacterium]